MYTPVDKNRLQGRLSHQYLEGLSPGTGTRHVAVGKLLTVYDQEYLSDAEVDIATQETLDSAPGLLFGVVQFSTGQKVLLPFKEPEEYVQLIHGNCILLIGRQVRVEYEAMNVQAGQITLSRSFQQKQLNNREESKSYDIGGIV